MLSTLPPDELLPVLVADLADDAAREVLDAAAFTGGRVWVPLENAPVNASQHVLEVHTPSTVDPFYYIAEPVGPPSEHGFPLRLQPMPDGPAPRRGSPLMPDFVLGRRQTNLTLTDSHAADLSHVGASPTDVDPRIGRALAGGKLVIEQLIGRGGVGAVYKARHRELMMPVAVKVLHESFQHDVDFARRFYAEALAASRLDHTNITRVLDFGQEPDGQLYFAMEYLDGTELRNVLEDERKLSGARIAPIMMQVCAGLSHAHARGIVHRDIKPENLVIVPSQDDDGRPMEIVKVCDFGIALHRQVPSDEDGVIAGTPEYMSPEQCSEDELDARSDIYACGVVLYELATGQVPFTADQPMKILNKHQYTPPLAPSRIDPSVDPLLEAIILKALAKDPADRQQSMRELRAELRQLLDPIMIDASPMPPSMRDVPESDSGPMMAAALVPRRKPDTLQDVTAASAPGESPAWLERGHQHQIPPSTRQETPSSDVDTLAENTVAWCARLAETTDVQAFTQAAQKLEPAIRALAARGDVHALWTVSSTMHGIASEGRAVAGSRAYSATMLLRIFEDPAILVQVGDQALNGPADSREKARRLLIHAGVYGAHALYGARVKLARVATARAPFIAMLKEFGPKAWPVVTSALEKIAGSKERNALTEELAEDLLLCVPVGGDESAGHLGLKFLRSTHSGGCRAATGAIVKLWGERAKPVLVAMVQSKEDTLRIAGIAGLRQLSAVDEHLVPRLHAILTRRVEAGEEVRAAAALALGHASETARQPAVSLLAQLLTPARGAGAPPPPPPSEQTPPRMTKQDAVVVAMAKSLLAIGGKPYRGLIAERAERSAEPLRGQLKGLLGH